MLAIGSDHGGLRLKEAVKKHLESAGYEIKDFGTYCVDSCDYPDIAQKVCLAVTDGECEKALLLCGTGIGMSMCANKISGIRAACCSDFFSARMSRLHNDANVLCLGERVVGVGLALDLVDVFLGTQFEGGRHAARVEKMQAL